MKLKNLLYLARFSGYMVTTLPNYFKAKRLSKKGDIAGSTAVAYRQSKDWSRYIFKLIQSEVVVKGLEHVPKDQSVLFVSNHQAIFDIPIIMHAVPAPSGFIAKKELEKMPIIGNWMSYIHCIFMDRSNPRQSLKAINEGAQVLRDGYNMIIFPEGTRSKTGELKDFKAGSFKLALKAKAPVVPVVIKNSYRLLQDGKLNKHQQVEVIFTPPIETAELTKEESAELPDRVHARIRQELDK
ncbi:lysophospholipid acyltransferase family protein [Marinicrinis sediminis]|uniref:1-acyl-sn-glycerol-3-phosphate acyltransferase n=1 Tax=Marinicrinis sediminis TaxID=1652465 RepID=A0ABW5R9I4_9BACL